MSSSLGERVKVTIFGESHGEAIGVVIDGLPAGEEISMESVRAFMSRRAGGKNPYVTPRAEKDEPVFLSGMTNGKTNGAPLCAIIQNEDMRSGHYGSQMDVPRPMHADYPAWVKYSGLSDHRGGGHFSGRLTAPMCIAGSVCAQILSRQGIYIGAHISSIGDISDILYDGVSITAEELNAVAAKDFPVIDDGAGIGMKEEIRKASEASDSIGGTIECCILGLPAGIGSPMFDGIENRLSRAVFGIPAVKGIEFGAGFAASKMRGSQHNDGYKIENGAVKTITNRHGGILGGISTGMPIIFNVAVKPTPSIGLEQKSVSLSKMCDTALKINGRHDPCIVPRAVPCVEAAAAITILDMKLMNL